MHEQYFGDPNTLDLAVMKKQAEERRDKKGEKSVIHRHKHGTECNSRCTIYIPDAPLLSFLKYKNNEEQ